MPTTTVRNLRIALVRRGLTMKEFAVRSGVHKNIISRAANGARVAPETLAKITRTLDQIPILPGADRVA